MFMNFDLTASIANSLSANRKEKTMCNPVKAKMKKKINPTAGGYGAAARKASFIALLVGICFFLTVDVSFSIGPPLTAKLSATPKSGTAPLSVDFDGSKSGTSAGCPINRAVWKFGDGSPQELGGFNNSHTYEDPGTYVASLSLENDCGETSSASVSIRVTSPVTPKVTVKASANPANGPAPLQVNFSATGEPASDPGCSQATYAWTFGDGANGTGASVSHTYAAPGTYQATVTYLAKLNGTINCSLKSDTDSVTVTVGNGSSERAPSEEPKTLAVTTTCEGNIFSEEGQICKYDDDEDGKTNRSIKETCRPTIQGGLLGGGFRVLCTTEYDDNGDGKVDRSSKETCTPNSSPIPGLNTHSCTTEYDDDGDGKTDRVSGKDCSIFPGHFCSTEWDDDNDGTGDRKANIRDCFVASCSIVWDDDNDGTDDRKANIKDCFAASCLIQWDDDNNGTDDRKANINCLAVSCLIQWDDDNDGTDDRKANINCLFAAFCLQELPSDFKPSGDTSGGSESNPEFPKLPNVPGAGFPTPKLEDSFPSLSVVVNEVAWMGTLGNDSNSREWIELYNPTNRDITLNGWRLVSSKPDASVQVTLKGKIPTRGYFLLEQLDDSTVSDIAADFLYSGELLDEGMTLLLLDPAGNRVDSVNLNGGSWPAGARIGALALSMERIDPRRADSDSNWGTNNTVTRNGRDATGNPLNGTPNARNSATQ